ncbi:ubiquitin C-terminal hydrolase family protein [Aspergillus vadensis CBS 113365]|uniref:ubiquitinyl hydrolase 1 n=1 Tax=Aspergillus vadensis (strain CBS 113365 / IMI 142717 / IBT 24658) TaxID=1448311 RepID=A0A319BR50_ASPVC|nr:ubiquitin C-terminal hydrolase family protein [Aspergillus vadensis CBS 113365]PYH74099.1 ubiquitin C-terminal hydrolase family protein [Aspergillus vadensis CBS 113365]
MSGIHRFLTRREKKNAKEEASNLLSRPHFRGFFSSDKIPTGDSNEDQKKIKVLEQRVAQLGITGLRPEHISYALQSEHAKGDVDKAFEMLMILEDAIEGIIRGYTPTTKLLGAVNREGVTCYLDALLFAMFARLDCFEAILYKSFNDEPRRKLSVLLRLWVNMLRSGRLITTDLTKHLQDALAECGWEDAAKLRQQDTSEAFTFITEKLELPLLTLKMDIYHTGKEDVTGDHKFVNERLLEVAIPEPADGETVTLEDCLESYFNNRIEVKRHLERRYTVGSTKSMDSIAKGCTTHVETIEVGSPLSPASSQSHSPLDDVTPVASLTEVVDSAPPPYRRSSIVQERFIPGDENAQDGTISSQRRGSYRKEVMMPAWQFFSLIPWYTDNTPTNDAQVAAHFSSKRPILGMCLKRYSMTPTGKAVRLNTFIDIPTEIGLPHFIQDDSMEEEGPIYGNFKLSLQAMVCHRGTSVDSGHYISIVRGTSAGAPPASSHGSDQEAGPSDASRYWMRFDDLAKERVTLVDIEQALKHESPYLLFYQILPINEDAAAANLFDKPPSSELSADSRDMENAYMAQKPQNLSVDDISGARAEGYASGRPSFEITGPDGADPAPMDHNSRKQSVAFSEVFDPTSMQSYAPTSPRLTPRDDDGRASFSFSRRSSRQTRSNPGSRAGSQASESRISTTFSRFTGRRSREKFTNDGVSEGEMDELTENELGPTEKFSPPSGERKDKSPRRTRESERVRDKLKDKSREKIGRKLDRECVVM